MGILVRPFTALVEDVQTEMREASTETAVENKYKRRVNYIYQFDIPSRFEWDWLHKVGTINLVARYNTGSVDVTNGSTAVTGHSTVWTAAMTGMKFTIPSTNEIYTFTRTAANTGTISPAYQGADATLTSYILFQDTYALASDYSKMSNEPGFYYDYSQGRQKLQWVDDYYWFRHYTTQTAQFPLYVRESPTKSSAGLYQVEVSPPVDQARILSYEFVKGLTAMTEFTTGTASTTLGSATVTTNADYSGIITAGQYFRSDTDANLTWSRITNVSTTTLTLADNYPSTNASAAYTVCDVPDMPYQLQEALFFGACYLSAVESGSGSSRDYMTAYLRALELDMSRRNRKRYGRQYMRHYTSIRPGSVG